MDINDLKFIGAILNEIGFPEKNITDLTKICISALLDKTPRKGLINNKTSLHDGARITDIIEYANSTFKNICYAENTRESIRKHSLKYLMNSNLIIRNADEPSRPTNSGNTNYTLVPEFENLILSYSNRTNFDKLKKHFLNTDVINVRDKLDKLKKLNDLSVELPSGKEIILSPGEHNIIEKTIVEDLFKVYPEPKLIYIGDTSNKVSEDLTDWDLCTLIGLEIDKHSKLPDVIGFDSKTNRVMIWEAVASCGPVNDLRKKELNELFKNCPFDIDYYTVFLTEKVYQKFASTISSGTSVYIIESKKHIIYSSFSNIF